MKKMTQKEFWAVLESAHIDKDIFGYEGILNMIAGYHNQLAKEQEARGCQCLYDAEMERFDTIYDALDARGYYDECRRK